MSYSYADRRKVDSAAPQDETAPARPSLDALRTGAAKPTAEQMGRRVDLPDAMRVKMEDAFGADLSAVKLYESEAVSDAGANAITQGSNIAFAPGMLDFSSYGGQALLGHEISHVVSQQRGEVTGGGFLNDHALEARADREGAMAAAGQQVSVPTASMSAVSAAPAAGPMQASKKEKDWNFTAPREEQTELPSRGIGFVLGSQNANDPGHGAEYQDLMDALKANAVAKGNREHLDPMAYDAMVANSTAKMIETMEAYRGKLKGERGGDKADRKRQIEFLDDMLKRARADKARSDARMTTTLSADDFSGGSSSGNLNEVEHMSRNGHKGFFKHGKKSMNGTEQQLMGFTSRDAGKSYDPRVADREVAFSRLGALLGSSVTVAAKKATLGSDAPGRKVLKPEERSGVLMDAAQGKSWQKYNWSYFGFAPFQPGADGRMPTAEDVMKAPRGAPGSNVATRLGAVRGWVQRKHTRDPGFAGNTMLDGTPFSDTGKEIDVADPDYQRQMNELFLLDTLAGHHDRHAGNYMVDRGDDDRVRVQAIDNDLTFSRKTDFGKRGGNRNYGGLPAMMQIDANMAKRIAKIDRTALNSTFADVLQKDEIDALEKRFDMMRAYIASLPKELLVEKWDESTALREFGLAGGTESYRNEDDKNPANPDAPVYSGNNYFQRQMLMLNAIDQKNQSLLHEAIGGD